MSAITHDQITSAPKVLLHDHLDGGLRPRTMVELAEQTGYADLPTTDPHALGRLLTQGGADGGLEAYLDAFRHTVGVLQTSQALRRVARECVEDLAADGVVYAEVRFAPELHVEAGLTLDEVMAAVLDGLEDGMAAHGIRVALLVTAMRTGGRSQEVAELAVRHRDRGAVGFDLAGAEAGYPPTRHLDAFQLVHRESYHATIHAGEAFGLPSIWEALHFCGAERLGHGVRIVDDITTDAQGRHRLGRLAAYVRDRRIPLELCPTSNVHTGAVDSIAAHPVGLLAELRFRVTVNTDNRLMSATSMTAELAALVDAFGWGWTELQRVTINAMKSAFIPFDERLALIDGVIKPGYALLLER